MCCIFLLDLSVSILKFIGAMATLYKQPSPLSVLQRNQIPSVNQDTYFGILCIGQDNIIWERKHLHCFQSSLIIEGSYPLGR